METLCLVECRVSLLCSQLAQLTHTILVSSPCTRLWEHFSLHNIRKLGSCGRGNNPEINMSVGARTPPPPPSPTLPHPPYHSHLSVYPDHTNQTFSLERGIEWSNPSHYQDLFCKQKMHLMLNLSKSFLFLRSELVQSYK